MAVASGTIDTMIRDIRRWINDRNVNPTYSDSELLRHLASGHDALVEDVFTATDDKPFMDFDFPLVANQQEYILPTGIGHVNQIAVLSVPVATATVSSVISAIIPTFREDDVRGPGWRWNPPILRFDRAPTGNLTIRVTFLPRAIDYTHKGTLTDDTKIINGTYDTSFTITVSSDATGTYKLWWKGQVMGTGVAVDATAATLETAIELLSNITDVTVTGDAGGPYTVLFVTPSGTLPPFEVNTQPTTGSVTVARVNDPIDTTVVLDNSPDIGNFDPRPNAFIGGRWRLLSSDKIPFDHIAMIWQERDIIEYDAASQKITLSSPLDFTPYGSTLVYEILPLGETVLFNAAAIETARLIHGMNGNVDRRNALALERKRATIVAKRMLGARNKARKIMPTPKRYLKGTSTLGPSYVSGKGLTQVGDNFLLP